MELKFHYCVNKDPKLPLLQKEKMWNEVIDMDHMFLNAINTIRAVDFWKEEGNIKLLKFKKFTNIPALLNSTFLQSPEYGLC